MTSTPPRTRRPRFHYTPSVGWTNDPLAVHAAPAGGWEMFVQFVPGRTTWATNCHWLTLTSPDLLHWVEAGVALTPGDGDDGCWSGCLTAGDPAPTMLYTSVVLPAVGVGDVREAHPPGDGASGWVKGPIVARLPDSVPAVAFRDPFFIEADGRMIVGVGLTDGTGGAAVFHPRDGGWTYGGFLARRHTSVTDGCWTGAMWECPQLIRLDDADLLVVSVWDADVLHDVACGIGTYHEGRLDVDRWHPLTHGRGYYAASSFRDEDGFPALVQWIRGLGDDEAGWAGAVSVPHRLTLVDGRPHLEPHPCVAAGRTAESGTLHGSGAVTLPSWHVDLQARHDRHGPAQLTLGCEAETAPVLELHAVQDHLSVAWQSPQGPQQVLLAGPAGDHALRMLVDGPVVELFAGTTGAVAAVLSLPDDEEQPPHLTWHGPEQSTVRIWSMD